GRAARAAGRADVAGEAAGVVERAAQQHLDLRVDAAQVVAGPAGEGVVHRGVEAQEHRLALRSLRAARARGRLLARRRPLARRGRLAAGRVPSGGHATARRRLLAVAGCVTLVGRRGPGGGHWYRDPVLTTGVTRLSPHSTTRRFDTIVARRSSSSVTTSSASSRASASSTMDTAPSTMRERAAMIAPACWRWSIAWAISGAYARLEMRASMTSTPATTTRAATSAAISADTTSVAPRSDCSPASASSYGWDIATWRSADSAWTRTKSV